MGCLRCMCLLACGFDGSMLGAGGTQVFREGAVRGLLELRIGKALGMQAGC